MTNKDRPLAPPVRGGRRDSSGSEDDLDPGRDISDDDDDFEDYDTSDSDDSDLEIPPDPYHEQRMEVLRREHTFLLNITAQQDEVLAQMRQRVAEIEAATELRRAELEEFRRARDAGELEEFRRARDAGELEEFLRAREAEAKKKAGDQKQGGEGGCHPPDTEKKDGDNDKDGSSPTPII